ncbi:hypothetical protein GCM10014713_02270 [Streptomyces purpureus]|uniref:Uncharacterized protein n=1 Tax=Streptomyces purpureus TaxID=1951 RepID=A0A918GW23_9ACTN|nr:hypothetical protein GCM10014713_02270 [Streptomyces purpureus]
MRPRPPAPARVALPTYRRIQRPEPRGGPTLVHLMLLVTAPAVLATAALRPRSR